MVLCWGAPPPVELYIVVFGCIQSLRNHLRGVNTGSNFNSISLKNHKGNISIWIVNFLLEIGSITGCCSCCWIRPFCGDEYGLVDHWSGIFSYKIWLSQCSYSLILDQRILGSRTCSSSCKAVVVVFVVTLIQLILKLFSFFLSALKNLLIPENHGPEVFWCILSFCSSGA